MTATATLTTRAAAAQAVASALYALDSVLTEDAPLKARVGAMAAGASWAVDLADADEGYLRMRIAELTLDYLRFAKSDDYSAKCFVANAEGHISALKAALAAN